VEGPVRETITEELLSFEVAEYRCVGHALSLKDHKSLVERAHVYVDTSIIESVLTRQLIGPTEFLEAMAEGNIPAGIVVSVYQRLLKESGFGGGRVGYEGGLIAARDFVDNDLIEGLRVFILAAGTMNNEAVEELSFPGLMRAVAQAERVLELQQQNFIGAMGGGNPLKMQWVDVKDLKSQRINQLHQSKASEVQALIDQQLSGPHRR
jgi:hypothetical protein